MNDWLWGDRRSNRRARGEVSHMGQTGGLHPHVASLIAARGSGPRSLHVGRPAAAVTSRRQLAGGMQAGARTDQGLGQGRRRLAEEIRKATLPVPATQSASGGRDGSVGP